MEPKDSLLCLLDSTLDQMNPVQTITPYFLSARVTAMIK